MKELTTGQYILKELTGRFRVTKKNIGTYGKMNKGPLHLSIDCYDVQNLGQYCILSVKGMFGLMNMETAVLAVTSKDIPLINFDAMRVGMKKLQLAEFYDTLLEDDNSLLRMECISIRNADDDLEDYQSGGHEYDSKLLDYSYGKKTKASSDRTDISAKRYADAVFNELQRAEDCDEQAKKEKIRRFADSLISAGGPAVSMFTKMFGEETAKKVVLQYMYGCESQD